MALVGQVLENAEIDPVLGKTLAVADRPSEASHSATVGTP
jgi:hypothetical protein